MVFLRMSAAALFPVVITAVFYLLEKKTSFNKINYFVRQTLIGIVFGLIACAATQFGIVNGAYVMNVRGAAPLTAGLLFGGPSGIIAGVIGGVYRWISVYFGVGTYTVVACSVATVAAGLAGAACRKLMFDNKKTSWFYGLFISMTIEVFHMLLVFVTHMDDIQRSFEIVKTCAVPMILANGISVMLSAMVVSALGKEKSRKKKDKRPITQTFAVSLFISVLIAYAVTSTFTFKLQNSISDSQVNELISMNIKDVESDIEDTSNSNLLDVTEQIARAIEQKELDIKLKSNPSAALIEQIREELAEFAEAYKVTEINIVGEDAVIALSSNESFDGFDMASDKDGQAAEFLCLLNGKKQFVQDLGPIDLNEEVLRKYAGVTLNDGGFVQVGYSYENFVDSINKSLKSNAQNRHIGQTGFVFILNEYTKEVVSAPSNTVNAESVLKFASELDIENNLKVSNFSDVNGKKYYYMQDHVEGYIVVGCIPADEAQFSRDISIYIGIFMQIVVFSTLFVLVYFLIKKIIVDNIHKINNSLSKITHGDLDTVVDVRANEEFSSLSDDINTTVSKLKDYIAEAESRIDKELEFAKTIQHSALPSVFPAYPSRNEFDIYADMFTAKEVGGDFYDFYMLGENKLAFLVADVSGKGIPAAMFMMTAKTMIKSFAESGLEVADILTQTNNKLCENNSAGMFVTAWIGILDLSTGVLKFANAGHNPPCIMKNGGTFELLKSRAGFVLAGMEGVAYRENELKLESGDRLYLYTDGVTEATDVKNELYGNDRLLACLNKSKDMSAQETCERVKKDVDDFVGEAPQFDDITMLSLNFYGKEGNKVKKLTLEASVENIEKVTEFVDEELDKLNCPKKAMAQINVAIDELFGNIANYAYHPEKGNATVAVKINDTPLSVEITFSDNGKPFNPLEAENPDITQPAEQRQIGGLGIFLVKKTMDNVTYEYKDGKNILTITKNM